MRSHFHNVLCLSEAKGMDISMEMDHEQALNYIYRSYLRAEPFLDFSAPDREKRKPEITKKLLTTLSDTPCTLVSGSKGKGSVAYMIAHIMKDYQKTGLMTSPHIQSFEERFRINDVCMSEQEFTAYTNRLAPYFDAIEATLSQKEYISPMGIQAAIALQYFQDMRTAFNVFECGKGVAFDDVGNIPHEYGVLNVIFKEHARELGPELADIARNKAAIMNGRQKCVFTAKQCGEVMEILKKRAADTHTRLKRYGREFYAEHIRFTGRGMEFDVVTEKHSYTGLRIPLLGVYQAENAALAVAFCEEILGILKEDKLKAALSSLNWPGRFEVLSDRPQIFLDACIHPESCKNVRGILERLHCGRIVTVIGIPEDKDYPGVAGCMADISEKIILTRSQSPHYRFSKQQKQVLERRGILAEYTENIIDAMELALSCGLPVCILATTSLIGEVRAWNASRQEREKTDRQDTQDL